MAADKITPVLLSGGAGTRLWPLSTAERPKQLLPLTGERTMLQMTAERAADPVTFSPPVVVLGAPYADLVAEQLSAIGLHPSAMLLEPVGRNTAPAIMLAALNAAPDTILLVMPSDHVISDTSSFLSAVRSGRSAAEAGYLVTFGVTAHYPETGYGYIRKGTPLGSGAFQVERFIEKPDAARAQVLLDEGDCYWNAGIFMFLAGRYAEAVEEHQPQVAAAVRLASAGARRDGMNIYPNADCFERSPSISIDHAILEKDSRVAVCTTDMAWSDVGSWDALASILPADEQGNRLDGQVVTLKTRGSLIRSDGPMVATLGVEDLIVIATEGAVLIMKRGMSQDVKDLAALAADLKIKGGF